MDEQLYTVSRQCEGTGLSHSCTWMKPCRTCISLLHVFGPSHVLADDDPEVFLGVCQLQVCVVECIFGRMTFLHIRH